MKLILASRVDPAAVNIAERLVEIGDFENTDHGFERDDALLFMVEGESTRVSSLPVNAQEVIVVSRHASESGRPTLTVHVPGLLDEGELAIASPPTLKATLLELRRVRDELNLQYEVSLEATHHGPVGLGVPVSFIEVGSTLEQWRDKKAAEAAARAALAALSSPPCIQAIGVGGIHYPLLHTRVVLETKLGIGHILPKYAPISEDLLRLAVQHTAGGVQVMVVDWKGLSSEQRAVCRRASEQLGIPQIRASVLLKNPSLISGP